MTPEERKVYVELARLNAESAQGRIQVQWKIVLSLWAAMGLVLWYVVDKNVDVPAWFALPAIALYWVTAVLVITPAFQTPHETDKAWQHHFMAIAQGRPSEAPKLRRPRWDIRTLKLPWPIAQVLITTILAAALVFAVLR